MEIINNFNNNINIYHSLILYNEDIPYDLINKLKVEDYPIVTLSKIDDITELEINYRMFVMHDSKFNELLYFKNNNIYQYSIIFCCDDRSYDNVINILHNKKPDCIENIIITKIFF
jgi:hypothetical protein